MKREIIKPIETQWNGYVFRSRLEARYAVLLTTLEIKFLYEPEGYDLGDGIYYLPDFFITWKPEMVPEHPGSGCYLEIKPTEPTDEEKEKARRLAAHTMHQVWIIWGAPGEHSIWTVSANGYEYRYADGWRVHDGFQFLCHAAGGNFHEADAIEAARSERFGT